MAVEKQDKVMEYTNTLKVLNEFAVAAIEAYRQGLTDYDAIASRSLFNHIDVDTVSAENGHMVVSIKLNEYWKFIENGRKAYGNDYKGHIPPIKAIEEWMSWRHIIPSDTQVGVPTYSSLTPELKETRAATTTTGLAWAIATNIAKKGIDAKPIMKGAINSVFTKFAKDISKAVAMDYNAEVVNLVASIFSEERLYKSGGKWFGETVYDTITL